MIVGACSRGAVQPALQPDGRDGRPPGSLSRPPLNATIVGRTKARVLAPGMAIRQTGLGTTRTSVGNDCEFEAVLDLGFMLVL